jgi:hypothetical protein
LLEHEPDCSSLNAWGVTEVGKNSLALSHSCGGWFLAI